MKIGILAWDYGEMDPAGPCAVEYGRKRGHEMSLFTLEEVSYATGSAGVRVFVGGEPADRFDAVICRTNLYGDDWQDRVERLTMLSDVPGLRVFDPADVWVDGYSKFRNAQKLASAGFPVPPIRSAATFDEVVSAQQQWPDMIVKPSFGYRGIDVERIRDVDAQKSTVEDMLARYATLVCQPFYSTRYGEYRVTVAGNATPINAFKLPPPDMWQCKALYGATFERVEISDDLADLSLRAARRMGMTVAGLDILPTEDGYVILEVNPVPGPLAVFGPRQQEQLFDAVFDWVEDAVRHGR